MPTALSTILESTIESELGVDTNFSGLTAAQKLQILNTAQQRVANLYNIKRTAINAGAVTISPVQLTPQNAYQDTSVGVAITTGTVKLTGTNGYIVSFSLASSKVNRVLQVQLYNGTDLSTPAIAADTWANLVSYCDSGTNECAFVQDGTTLNVFALAATFPNVIATKVNTNFLRDSVDLTATSDMMDIPPEARDLLKAIAIEEVYAGLGKKIPTFYRETINSEKSRLSLVS